MHPEHTKIGRALCFHGKSIQPCFCGIIRMSRSHTVTSESGLAMEGDKRRFRSLFGISAEVCAIVWKRIEAGRPSKSEPRHLLWSLMFLKVYATATVHATIANVEEKTFRKWVRAFVDVLSKTGTVRYRFILCRALIPRSNFRIRFYGLNPACIPHHRWQTTVDTVECLSMALTWKYRSRLTSTQNGGHTS